MDYMLSLNKYINIVAENMTFNYECPFTQIMLVLF